MSDQENKTITPGAQPPTETQLVQIEPGSKVAGGVPAILVTAKTAWSEMGVGRGVRTLLKLNQKTGFDCPGCAWPEPDAERSHAEFCENGAKHVADEATTKRITPRVFHEWSVADLAEQSDMWLGKQGRITHPMVLRRELDTLRSDKLGRSVCIDCRRVELAEPPGRSDLLHLRPHQQRSCVSSISSLSGSLAPTIFLIAQTCVMNRAAPRSAKRLASAKARSRSKTSIWPRRFSSSDKIPERTIRAC